MIIISGCILFTIVFIYSTQELKVLPQELIDHHAIKEDGGVYRILKGPMPSVNLVIAATTKENYGWVKDLKVPGMNVVPYIADDLNAMHHAQQNKGHEAMMYHHVPREQYHHHINWLLSTKFKDSISGRTWEHMWQYLFLEKAIDCPLEHKAYCRLYHICFGGREEYDEWIELNQGRQKLEKELDTLIKGPEKKKDKDGKEVEEKEVVVLTETEKKAKETMKISLEKELRTVKEAIRVRKEVAVVRGSVDANRVAEGQNLYVDEGEPEVEVKIFPQVVASAGISSTALP
ncbi:hypothetical protein IFR05_005673 [Cadophora sp. M221]|nr:hypothetical protein IFR05_005673 [Cadophora sp. M221]